MLALAAIALAALAPGQTAPVPIPPGQTAPGQTQNPPVPAAPQAPGKQDEAFAPRSFEEKLDLHPYFAKLAFERVENHPPYLFLIQKTGRDDPARIERVVTQYVALFEPLLARFEHDVAQPLGLVQRDDRARFPFVLLASRGDLENYRGVTHALAHAEPAVFYERGLNAAVLYEDAFATQRPPGERARAGRHALVHLCQQAWYTGGKNAPLDSWVLEGMADCFARREAEAEPTPVPSEWLAEFARDAGDDDKRWGNLRTLEELFTVTDPARLAGFLNSHAPNPNAIDLDLAERAFYRESSLYFQFLWEAAQAKYRPVLLAYVGRVLAGRGERGNFGDGTTNTAALDREFLAWLRVAHELALPAEARAAAAFEGALERDVEKRSALPVASESFAPPLELADATPDERLGLALHELAHGSARKAREALEALEREPLDALLHERAGREARRAAAWIAVRDAYLAALIAGQKPFEFTLGGRSVRARILSREGDELVLEKNRAGLERVSVDELDPLALAQAIKPTGGANDWARVLPYVLRDPARAKKLLADSKDEGAALLVDLNGDYPARLRVGEAAAGLIASAALAPPATPAECDAQLDALAALKAQYGDLAVFVRKAAAVRGRARTLLERKVELIGTNALLRGKLEVLPNERVRLTYEFDDPRELEDFDPENYPALMRKALGTEEIDDVPFHVEKGALVAAGQASLRSFVDLSAPLDVKYSLEYVSLPQGEAHPAIAVGLCDDGHEHFVWGINMEHLQRYEPDGNDHAHGTPGSTFMNTPYAMELVHDGTQVKLLCEGKPQQTLGAGGRQAGAVFLCTQSNCPIRIARLQIEGQLLPASFARLAQGFIERDLKARF